MADYECWPPWVYTEAGQLPSNTNPADLATSRSLVGRLNSWAAQYDASLNRDDPASSGFADPQIEDDFLAHGLAARSRTRPQGRRGRGHSPSHHKGTAHSLPGSPRPVGLDHPQWTVIGIPEGHPH